MEVKGSVGPVSGSMEGYSSNPAIVIPGPRTVARKIYRGGGKRATDFVLAVLMLPILLPVIAVIWFLVRREGGPGFFGQDRVGRGGRTFKCMKIRTMVPDAEAKLQAYLDADPEAAAEWNEYQKLTNDPRVTRLGQFLRATSLDELPQIFNVLKGDMSFVGPRPAMPDQMPLYGRARHAYCAERPGITGIWQISGRNDVNFDQRIQYDADYMRTSSFAFDLKCIAKTAKSVLIRSGK